MTKDVRSKVQGGTADFYQVGGAGSIPADRSTLFDLPVEWANTWTCKTVTTDTAAPWFARYHYLRNVPASATCWGVFAGDLVACVAIGEPTNASGVAEKYGLDPNTGNREIVRVAVHDDAPENAASRAVRAAVSAHHAATGLLWLFSYADTGQGHHGGIYQALGAVYVGLSPAERGYIVDGVRVHPRTMVARFGGRSAARVDELRSEGRDVVVVDGLNAAKHTYIIPIGPKASRRRLRDQLAPIALPYPKRNAMLGVLGWAVLER